MKPSSSTQVRSHSIRVRTLDDSKDVRGARREPKGRLESWSTWHPVVSLRVQRWSNPRNVYLSCTKGDLRLPWCRYVWVYVRNNCPAGCNRFELSSLRIMSNLAEPLHRSNWTMECDGYDEHGKYYTGHGYYCVLLMISHMVGIG